MTPREVTVAAGGGLPGILTDSPRAAATVVFAHGSGSSRLSPRNAAVAAALNEGGFATLLFDLLTPAEAAARTNVFDIGLLAERLDAACTWLQSYSAPLALGLFGASTGAAAAVVAATARDDVGAVVSRGGRPDLAADRLPEMAAPTLLIVGGDDHTVLELNRQARARLGGISELAVIPGASHLFEEPGALEQVAALAASWFRTYLTA